MLSILFVQLSYFVFKGDCDMLMLFKAKWLTLRGTDTQAPCIKTHVNPYNVVVGPVPEEKNLFHFEPMGLQRRIVFLGLFGQNVKVNQMYNGEGDQEGLFLCSSKHTLSLKMSMTLSLGRKGFTTQRILEFGHSPLHELTCLIA